MTTEHTDTDWPWSLTDDSADLVRPRSLTVDRSPSAERARQMVRLAQLPYTFWDTGEQKYLESAVDTGFVDNTLPLGRPQGFAGPAFASTAFRAAVPDLTCELADVLILEDMITARLVFRGHFTGSLQGTDGAGQTIEFNAIEIQHVSEEKIINGWHTEDNLAFLQQIGLA